MVIIYECAPGEFFLDSSNVHSWGLALWAPCCSQMGSYVIYKGHHRTVGQHRDIFQESLVLFCFEDVVFSEMELILLVFMNPSQPRYDISEL